MKPFIHLHNLTDYSLGKSNIKIVDLVATCRKYKMPAIAITDENNLFGSLNFTFECIKNGIQPILGASISVRYKQKIKLREVHFIANVTLLVKDRGGYLNLVDMISKLYLKRQGEEISIDMEELVAKSKGLILLMGAKSHFGHLINMHREEFIEDIISKIKRNFQNDFFIELNRYSDARTKVFENIMLKTAYANNIPLVATNVIDHISEATAESHDALICIASNKYIMQDDRPHSEKDHFFKTQKEMQELFADLPEALENTSNIAQKCLFMLESRAALLPKFIEKEDEHAFLINEAKNGLHKRLRQKQYNIHERDYHKYLQQMDFELDVIGKMGFAGYFLIVADFIKWSKDNQISVGPGRGSGAGSVVAWSLEITDIDPLRFNLLFERFLNPDRVSMPDFDIDFCQTRRDEVISYVRKKYGADRVAQIITFGKLQPRAVLRDVGRVLQIPYGLVDKICKMVPNNPANPVTLQQAIDLDKELRKMAETNPDVEKLLKISLQLEGAHRHVSTHAAGVVIADRDIRELVPLYKDHESSFPAVQYTMKDAESIGLMKFDFLGLKTLTVIAQACSLIQQRYGISLKPNEFMFDDKKSYEMLSKGFTAGVFQFEGFGMREAIKRLKPDRIEDLIALTSLYRPGPMDNIPHYINRKHGTEAVQDIHPMIADILKETYGIIVYQEQVMQIAQKLANYSLGEADILRRAMGKKNKKEMEEQKNIFIERAVQNGVEKKSAENIFEFVEKFASYGFNKSHAAAYSAISYQTAYLKANYTIEFLIASINLDIHDPDKVYLFCTEAKKFNINTFAPSINKSDVYFKAEDDSCIRFGLAGIKGAGIKILEAIIQERERAGPYQDIYDFVERAYPLGLNKRILEALIKSTALEEIYEDSGRLFFNVSHILSYYKSKNEEDDILKNQMSLLNFDNKEKGALVKDKIIFLDSKAWSFLEKANAEYQALGFYLARHPLEMYSKKLEKLGTVSLNEVEFASRENNFQVSVASVITSKKVRSSKNGKFAFLQLSDMSGILDVSLFNEAMLYSHADLLNEGSIILCNILVRKDANATRITVEEVSDLHDVIAKIKICYMIKIENDPMIIKELVDFFSNRDNFLYEEGAANFSKVEVIECNDIVIQMKLVEREGGALKVLNDSEYAVVDFKLDVEKEKNEKKYLIKEKLDIFISQRKDMILLEEK